MSVCATSGLWDQILNAPYLSKQQWRAANLIILCQLVGLAGTPPVMSACEVSGLWNQVAGTGPFLSEQEFMAENINLLCQLVAGGGGGGSTVNPVYTGAAPPAAPAFPAQGAFFVPDNAVLPIQTWNPTAAAWRDV